MSEKYKEFSHYICIYGACRLKSREIKKLLKKFSISSFPRTIKYLIKIKISSDKGEINRNINSCIFWNKNHHSTRSVWPFLGVVQGANGTDLVVDYLCLA